MFRRHRRLIVAALLSVVAHLPAAYVGGASLMSGRRGDDEPVYFEVMPFERDDLSSEEVTEEERAEDEAYDPEDEVPDERVVSTEEGGEERRPEEPEYLSHRDQVVERQTRVANRRPRDERASESQSTEASEGAPPMVADFVPRDRPLPLGLTVQDQGMESSERGEHVPDHAPPPMPPTPLELNPSLTSLVDATGGVGLDDTDEVEEGEIDLLSSARWLHAPFMQRFSRQVEQHWYPNVSAAIRRSDPGGHIYGYRDRTTVVRVVLNAQGGLERAYVVRESGAPYLDDVARRSIEAAAPVPNPPRGLVDEATGTIVFSFGFTVRFNESPILRLRRFR
jgi:TonB family protein